MQKTYFLVAYDITDTSLRSKVADSLLYFGLTRVQYSVFEGMVEAGEKKELLEELKNFALKEGDKIYLFPLCRRCIEKKIVLGKGVEEGEQEHLIL